MRGGRGVVALACLALVARAAAQPSAGARRDSGPAPVPLSLAEVNCVSKVYSCCTKKPRWPDLQKTHCRQPPVQLQMHQDFCAPADAAGPAALSLDLTTPVVKGSGSTAASELTRAALTNASATGNAQMSLTYDSVGSGQGALCVKRLEAVGWQRLRFLTACSSCAPGTSRSPLTLLRRPEELAAECLRLCNQRRPAQRGCLQLLGQVRASFFSASSSFARKSVLADCFSVHSPGSERVVCCTGTCFRFPLLSVL